MNVVDMKLTMIAALICFTLVQSVAASTYRCSMNKFIYLEDDMITDGQLHDFFFVVERDFIRFSEGGFFDGAKMPIRLQSKDWLRASDTTDVFDMKDGRFHYSMVTFLNVRSASGICEKEN